MADCSSKPIVVDVRANGESSKSTNNNYSASNGITTAAVINGHVPNGITASHETTSASATTELDDTNDDKYAQRDDCRHHSEQKSQR